MTVTTETTPATLDLQAMTDTELLEMWRSDGTAAAAALAEAERRDQASRAAKTRERRERADRQLQYEWYDAMHAQRTAFEAEGIGYALNKEGQRRGISEWALWTGPSCLVERYGTTELKDFFARWPRLTFAEWKRQRHMAGRIQRDEWRDRNETNREATHEHDATGRAGLADTDPSALRRDPPAPQAPQTGPGRTVQRSRPGDDRTEDSRGDRADGRPAGPVQRNGLEGEGAGDMTKTAVCSRHETRVGTLRQCGNCIQPGDACLPRAVASLAPTFDEVPEMPEVPEQDGSDDLLPSGTRAKTFAEVEEIDQEWLWPGMIPAGLLTVVFGPPKASKTTLVIDYASRVSRGDVNPDGTSLGPAAPVLMGALEDISESSTVKKLKAAKADLSMVVDISGGPDGDGLELELDHVAWLHEVAAEHPGVALIVIDTLSNSANKPITTRPGLKAMLKPLAALAANTGAAVILTAHSLKGHDDIPEGGRSLVSIPRMVLQIGKSQDEPGVRTLSVHASNVASDSGEGYRYKLIEDGAASRLEWCWDAVRTGPGPEATGQARILLLLRNSDAPLSAQLIAAKTGVSYPVTRVLLSRMKKRGEVAGGEARGTWAVPEVAQRVVNVA